MQLRVQGRRGDQQTADHSQSPAEPTNLVSKDGWNHNMKTLWR
jgi:hypothetical protein